MRFDDGSEVLQVDQMGSAYCSVDIPADMREAMLKVIERRWTGCTRFREADDKSGPTAPSGSSGSKVNGKNGLVALSGSGGSKAGLASVLTSSTAFLKQIVSEPGFGRAGKQESLVQFVRSKCDSPVGPVCTDWVPISDGFTQPCFKESEDWRELSASVLL